MKKIIYVLLIVTIIGCSKDATVGISNYPYLTTLPVTEISKNGAVMTAEFTDLGSFEIEEFGFIWYLDNSSEERRTVKDQVASLGSYSLNVSTTLFKGGEYKVKAFATSDGKTTYGNEVSFVSLGSKAPIISLIKPINVSYCDTIEIHGKNFSTANLNQIRFSGLDYNDNSGEKVIFKSDSLLKVLYPRTGTVQKSLISVSILSNIAYAPNSITFLAPVINGLSKETSVPGDTLIINGENFIGHYHIITSNESPDIELVSVLFNNKKGEILNIDCNQIEVVVPSVSNPINIDVKMNSGVSSSTKDLKMLEPEIIQISPEEGFWGDEVEISGQNFGHLEEGVQVYFNNQKATVNEFSNDKIIAKVPEGVKNPIEVKVITIGFVSNTSSFYYLGPEIISVSPQEATWGDVITITGNNFSERNEEILLTVNGIGIELNNSSNTELQFTIPDDILVKRLDLEVTVNNARDFVEYKLASPKVISVSPSVITSPEEIITISGKNFHPNTVNNSVSLSGKNLIVLSTTQNEIICKIGSSFLEHPLLTTYVNAPLRISNGVETISSNNFIFNYLTEWSDFDTNINFSYFGNIDAYFTIGNKGYFVFRNRQLYEFNFQNNSFTRKKSFPGDGGTNGRRFYGTSFSLNGEGYYGLGVVKCINQSNPNIVCGKVKNDLWKYNAESDTWSRLNDVPLSGGFVIELDRNLTVNAATVTDESVYLTSLIGTGGNFLYDSSTDSWVQKEPINNESSVISQSLRTFAVADKMYAVYKNYEGTYHVAEYLDYSDTWSIIRSEVGFNFILDIRVLGDRVIMLDVNYEDNVTFSSKLKSAAIVDLEFNEIESPSDQMVAIPFINGNDVYIWGSLFDDLLLKYTLK